MDNTFDHLYILGRPASGKSEFIDFMKKVRNSERADRYHIGHFVELDDFVWLWEKFLEDDIWEKVIGKRLFSSRYEGQYNMEDARLFDFMIENNSNYMKILEGKYAERKGSNQSSKYDRYFDGTE